MMSLVPMRVESHGQGQRRARSFIAATPRARSPRRVGRTDRRALAIGREEMDAFAFKSHARAVAAEDRGVTQRAIAPVDMPRARTARSARRTRRGPTARHDDREARVAEARLR